MTELSGESLMRKLNAEKIARMGDLHIYDYEEWCTWTGNNYIKSHYDVLLPDGTVLEHCRPNAGVMFEHRGVREFRAEDNVKVRLSKTSPWTA